MHVANLAVREGSLLALDLLEPVPSRPRSQAAQQYQELPTTSEGCCDTLHHQEPQLQHERESLLCEKLQAAAFEWCKVSGLSSLLVTGNVLTLQVNNQLRSCFWDAALSSWTSELSTEVPNHSAYHIALSSPALFLPHAPSSLQRWQQQRQQQLGANLQPHQQLHMDVTFQARVSMPAGCTLAGWDYTCATSSHLRRQRQQQQLQQPPQQQQQHGEQRSTHSSDPPHEIQLLARANGSYLPVSILNGGPQPTQAPCEHELQAQLSLPLSLVQQGGCCPVTLELWCVHDARSLLRASSSTGSAGNGSRDGGALNGRTSTGESENAAHHHHHLALREAGGVPHTLSSSAVAQDVQASSWTMVSSEHSSALGMFEQEAARRAMVSDWLNNAPPPPTPHNYTHTVACAPLLLLPSSMVQEVAELEAWAAGLSDPSQPPPSPALVHSFLFDLGSWMQFAHSRAAGVGSSSAKSDQMGGINSNGNEAQAHTQVGHAGAEERMLPAASRAGTAGAVVPASASGATAPGAAGAVAPGAAGAAAPGAAGAAAAPCCPKQHLQHHGDRTLHTGRAGAGLVIAQHAAPAPVERPPLAQPNSTTASTAGAACQPQHACASGDSAARVQRVGECEECGGAVVEAMAEVGRTLLHQATRWGLANVAGLLVHHLLRPPLGKPFAWLVSGGEEEEEQELSNVEEAAPTTGSSRLPKIADAAHGGACAGRGGAGDCGSGDSRVEEGFAERPQDSSMSRCSQRASDTQPDFATADAQQGGGREDRVVQRATIGGPLSVGVAAEGEEGGGNAKPPTWMPNATSNGGLPTCFSFSPFVADAAAAQSPPSASPHAPAAAAAAPASMVAPHSTKPPHGAPAPEGLRLHTRSSPLALLHTNPKPVVHQQRLLHAALLSGQPHMVAAVLSWGHAQPNWVWRFDQENVEGVSPRSLAQSLPQRDELVPLLLCPNEPPSSHPPPPHPATPTQAAHHATGTSRHDIHQLGQSQGQITPTQNQSGIRADQAPSEAAQGRTAPQKPNLARRGWFPGARATAVGEPASTSTHEPNFVTRGWFQDAAAAAYAACARPNLSRSGCLRRGELQGSSEISAPEDEQPCPTSGPQVPGQRSNVESGGAAAGASSVGNYTGPVASALPPRLARSPPLTRSPAPGQHGQQGSSPAWDTSWYARCFSLPERPPPAPDASWYARSTSLPVGDKQGPATAMGSMAASLAQFARRSRGILLGQLDPSHGPSGIENTNSVSSATASSITPSSTTRPSGLSQAPSSSSHPSPIGNFARASTSSTINYHQQPHPCPPNSPHSLQGRGNPTHPVAASNSPSLWWGRVRSLIPYLSGGNPSTSKDCSNAHSGSGGQGRNVAREVAQQQQVLSPAAAGCGHTSDVAHGPGSTASRRAAGATAGISSSGTVSRLGYQAPSAAYATFGPQEGGGGAVSASRSPGGIASSPWVAALYVGVVGLALVVWLCMAWQGLRGSGVATGSGSGSDMIPGVGLAHSGEPVCKNSEGEVSASMMCLASDPVEHHHVGRWQPEGPASATPQLGQEGAGRWRGEGDGTWSQQQQQQQQQEAEHLLELPQLSAWEQVCVLLEYCIPLILSQTTLGDVAPGARK
ncbi:hypothetical protein DUNSADRAFT_2829, partial [Dunaliella salina]